MDSDDPVARRFAELEFEESYAGPDKELVRWIGHGMHQAFDAVGGSPFVYADVWLCASAARSVVQTAYQRGLMRMDLLYRFDH